MPRKRKAEPAVVGVMDHDGWAVLVTASRSGALLDRRRVELVDEGLPTMPHHHEGQRLPLRDAVSLVERVRASAERNAPLVLEALAAGVAVPITGLALRACPPLPPTVAERITDYRSMCVADWVMYRQVLATAATARGWGVSWFDAKQVLEQAATALEREDLDQLFDQIRATAGPPWQKDHKTALAAAIVAANRSA